ncbi:receptor-type tyrosine-protein phosphatase N2-like [Haliotis cracherodii]|uniref:receptor-type tyrosine-protein phosphatase N2-like n=1 Tax=Haliotis cracherodii TaxID=6455 RepID=UPI0039EA4B8C
MKEVSRVLFLAALAVLGQKTSFGLGAQIQSPFPLGTIGCLLSDVCAPGQQCKDDQLFGSCESLQYREISEGEFEFRLTTHQLEQLEDQIWLLIRKGFTWKDAYTQCSLQNLLLAFAQGETFDSRWCEEALSQPNSYSENVKEEIATVLQKLMDFQDGHRLQASAEGLSQADMDSLIPSSDKRDEFVNIHKYFDASKGQYKRDPYMEEETNPRNYLTPLGMSDTSGGEMAYLQDVPQQESQSEEDSYKMAQYLLALERMAGTGQEKELSEQDLGLGDYGTPDYIEETASPETIISDAPDVLGTEQMSYPPMEPESLGPQMDAEGMDNNAPANEATKLLDNSDSGKDDSLGLDSSADAPAEPVREDSESVQGADILSISPPDEKTLEDLLEGNVKAKNLEDPQLQRLTKYVEAMVDTLDTDQTDTEVLEKGGDSDVMSSPVQEVPEVPISQSQAMIAPPMEEFPVNKKAIDQSEVEETETDEDADLKRSNVVKTRYAYVEVSQPITPAQATAFVMNLTKVIGLNTTFVDDIQVEDGKVVFKVKANPYMNASDVADKANSDEVRTQLTKLTGFDLKNAGIGKENQVALKKDNKYVVLTFILVGSIAGILLAVVVIYIIKRHTRSKEKLAQLSATGEGNEASKDYQDLCRQRMQSKSSEKPEPLHAASRIGSVSESQVRSPSSRSSTSSWSEEPVASNMDISTGHIVLSYMEDHLKNQDRLDQEWEALCAYEADPCATAVAADPSNTRKNRYGDILPYDHSRVVISTAANVSGSDYINANFITDHDPRNPAFIATQGPLPHTVADFWQMVWEQGSVVIVMLSKLTETGTAMCHRYWPEEGSDLYHIYEVHLVSEHIWCDDYLVRSFYLKNLQTNETRTVTQFHFLTWPNLCVPGSIKALLDFRRKVNKSYRGRSCPIVVHCSDGCGRTGTYCLIDMVLNRMAKGAKEIDMAATLEHIRDQRMGMVKTKEQFQFSLAAVAEEVHAILKALPQ